MIHLFQLEWSWSPCAHSLAVSCSSTWGQWSISHCAHKSLLFHSASLSTHTKHAHNKKLHCAFFIMNSTSTLACSPQVCLWLWLWLNQPDKASWNTLHKRKHFCYLGQNLRKWCMLLWTLTTGVGSLPGTYTLWAVVWHLHCSQQTVIITKKNLILIEFVVYFSFFSSLFLLLRTYKCYYAGFTILENINFMNWKH